MIRPFTCFLDDLTTVLSQWYSVTVVLQKRRIDFEKLTLRCSSRYWPIFDEIPVTEEGIDFLLPECLTVRVCKRYTTPNNGDSSNENDQLVQTYCQANSDYDDQEVTYIIEILVGCQYKECFSD